MSECKNWFKAENKAGSGEIQIMGYIVDDMWYDDEVSPKWFKDELTKLKDVKDIHIYVNSGGGSVFAGLAIHNMIKNTDAYVTTHIMGLAASTASWMIAPSNKIMMPQNAFMMTHLPTVPVWGNKNDLAKSMNFLEQLESVIAESYLRGSNKLTTEKATELLNNGETWLDGQQAYDCGLVDVVESSVAVAAKFNGNNAVINGIEHDMTKYKSFPKQNFEKPDDTDNKPKFERIITARNKLLNIKKEAYNGQS